MGFICYRLKHNEYVRSHLKRRSSLAYSCPLGMAFAQACPQVVEQALKSTVWHTAHSPLPLF